MKSSYTCYVNTWCTNNFELKKYFEIKNKIETNVSKCLLTQMCEFLKQTNQEEDFIKMLKKNLVNDDPTEEEICLVKLTLEKFRNLSDELA